LDVELLEVKEKAVAVIAKGGDLSSLIVIYQELYKEAQKYVSTIYLYPSITD
jgi:hypothetical protein